MRLFNNNIDIGLLVGLAAKYHKSTRNLLTDKIFSVLSGKTYTANYPRLINIFVTNRCNLACPHCLNADFRASKKKNDLPYETIETILPELKKEKPLIYMVGGEPLLSKTIFPIIRAFKNINICTGLTTNGILLSKRIDEILSCGLEFLSISLDHFEKEIQDKAKGVPGSFQRTVDGIKDFVGARRKLPSNIKVNTVILHSNYNQLSQLFDIVESLGVDEWSIQHNSFVSPVVLKEIQKYKKSTGIGDYYDGTIIDRPFFLENEKISELDAELTEVMKKARKSAMNVNIRPFCNNKADYYRGITPEVSSSCSFYNYSVNINEAGSVYSCLGYELGSLHKEKSLKKIWNNDKTRFFQKHMQENFPVPGCFRCCALNYKF